MSPRDIARSALALFCLSATTCVGTTGGELVEFEAFAAGPAHLVAGEPYQFENQRGYTVVLTEATFHIGAVYLNRSVPTSVSQDTSCYLPGVYVAEVPGGVDIDLLDPSPVRFDVSGSGTTDEAKTAEIWLTGGQIDAPTDPTVIARVAGTARRGQEEYPFEGSVTISSNRAREPDPTLPGADPICKQRVVTPIVVDIVPYEGGALTVRVDPAEWFQNVDFELLEETSADSGEYRFRDDDGDQPSRNLYSGIRANAGVYSITFE